MSSKFKKASGSMSGNSILNGEGFYISYLPPGGMGGFSFFASETALCAKGEYYILNGDHRKEYEKLAPEGFNACFKYYNKQIDQKSLWSN